SCSTKFPARTSPLARARRSAPTPSRAHEKGQRLLVQRLRCNRVHGFPDQRIAQSRWRAHRPVLRCHQDRRMPCKAEPDRRQHDRCGPPPWWRRAAWQNRLERLGVLAFPNMIVTLGIEFQIELTFFFKFRSEPWIVAPVRANDDRILRSALP